MTLYLLFNGPPRSGKSTMARSIAAGMPDSRVSTIGFSYHLKRFVHGIYLGRQGWDLDPDAFDANKNDPQELLGGMSWRQAYIHYSEKVIKPLHGEEWFGEMLVREAMKDDPDVVAVPDSGFRKEGERVVREVGPENVLLLRMHRTGCDFPCDSRSYISLADLGVATYDVENREGCVEDTRDYVLRVALGGRHALT